MQKNTRSAVRPKYGMFRNAWFMIRLAWTCHEKKVLVLSLLSAFSALALNLINLYISPTILAAVERRAPASELALTIALFVGALMLASALSAYVDANKLYGRVTVRMEIISRIAEKASTTSYPNLSEDSFSKLLAKSSDATGNNASAGEATCETLTDLLTNLTGFLIYLLLLSNLQPLLMLVVVATTTAGYFVSNYLNEWGHRHRDEEAEYSRHLGYVDRKSRDPKLSKEIRLFGLRDWLNDLYDKSMSAYIAFHRRAEGVYFWARIVDLVLAFARGAVAYAYLIGLVVHRQIDVPGFLLYFSAVSGFTTWITGILAGFSRLHNQSIDLSTIREFLEYPEPFRFESGESLSAVPGETYELRLEDVSFRYPGAEKNTLSHINLTLKPGENLAVVGLNGAGKTTLVSLMCGFLNPTEGRVLLNGRDVREYNRTDYYKLFSAVFQAFEMLPGSVALNVAQRPDEIDMDRVKRCIEKAGLREKIESLSAGYDSLLQRSVYDDATAFSGGEEQRLMLARALYKDAPFVILDEPTAALDPLAESEMYRRYSEMTCGKSSVYISHRLASTRFCDRIIMLDNGGIGEEGTHEALLKLGGKYAELFEIQSKYYREGENRNEDE